LVVTGHCFMTGGEVSDLSERRIFGGNQQALPVSLFPDSISYVALGHLHKAQRVGGRDSVRYCGSPLPLSVTEREYRHQVLLVDLDGPSASVTPLVVPRAVEILRVPARGAASPEEALATLRLLEADPAVPRPLQPYLDVVVTLTEPAPGLRRDIDEALAGKGVRLARLKTETAGKVVAQPDAPVDLETLPPEEVFVQCWRRVHADGPPDAYLGAFRELLHAVEGGQ
jgi:exonuclease SbcD